MGKIAMALGLQANPEKERRKTIASLEQELQKLKTVEGKIKLLIRDAAKIGVAADEAKIGIGAGAGRIIGISQNILESIRGIERISRIRGRRLKVLISANVRSGESKKYYEALRKEGIEKKEMLTLEAMLIKALESFRQSGELSHLFQFFSFAEKAVKSEISLVAAEIRDISRGNAAA